MPEDFKLQPKENQSFVNNSHSQESLSHKTKNKKVCFPSLLPSSKAQCLQTKFLTLQFSHIFNNVLTGISAQQHCMLFQTAMKDINHSLICMLGITACSQMRLLVTLKVSISFNSCTIQNVEERFLNGHCT